MKIGILILFSDCEKEINKMMIRQLSQHTNSEICLINNASKDATYSVLKEVRNSIGKHISLIDIKKNKGLEPAIKAGIRFLLNKEELKYFIYLKSSQLSNVNELITKFNYDKQRSFNPDCKLLLNKKRVFKNVYSFHEIQHA